MLLQTGSFGLTRLILSPHFTFLVLLYRVYSANTYIVQAENWMQWQQGVSIWLSNVLLAKGLQRLVYKYFVTTFNKNTNTVKKNISNDKHYVVLDWIRRILCLYILQVFAIELVTFAVDFIPLAVEFGAFAVEFVALALQFVALAIELDAFTMGLVTFALEFVIARLTSWSKHENKM